jgi:tetratricopeptide (TPR) repeat protein
MNLADACEHSGNVADARSGLERALEGAKDKEASALRDRLRHVYEVTGARRELSALLRTDARAEPNVTRRVELLIRSAELLLGQDAEPAEAARVLEEAQRLSPENITGVVLLARAHGLLGRPEAALSSLEAVIAAHRGRRTRELSAVYHEVSNVHLESGNLKGALDALARAFDLDMRNGDLAMQLGHLALDVSDGDVAQRAFRSVTMMRLRQPGGTEGASADAKAVAYYHLSRIAQAEGDIRKARLMASKAVSENPGHAEAHAILKELRLP